MRITLVATLLALVAVFTAACDDDATPTSTPTATSTVTAVATPTATAADAKAALIAQFPTEVQPLLEPVWSADVIQLLLEVRNEGPGTIVWQDAGGEFNEGQQRAFLREWEQITGWTINAVSAATDAIVLLEEQVRAGAPEWDATELGSYGTGNRQAEEGLLEKIDLKYFPTEFYPESTLVSDDWVSLLDTGTVLIYNKNAFPAGTEPTKVSDLFDTTKYPDEIRCLYANAQFGWPFEYALLADGVDVNEVYPMLETQEGVDRALAKLDTIKDKIVYWGSGAESVQFILDGQCDMGLAWNGRPALRMKDEPTLPLAVSWDGAMLDAGPYGIPRGAKEPKAALSALAYAVSPNNQCDLENELAYGIIMNTEPFPDCLTDFAKEWGPQTDVTLPIPPDPDFWSANDKRMEELWTAWKIQ